jgi:hypothetical protein
MSEFNFKSKVWVYPSMGAWRFLSLPVKESKIIKHLFGDLKKGFGSLRVKVIVNKIVWTTSIFPDSKRNCYLLPLKKDVRTKAQIKDGDSINFTIQILI